MAERVQCRYYYYYLLYGLVYRAHSFRVQVSALSTGIASLALYTCRIRARSMSVNADSAKYRTDSFRFVIILRDRLFYFHSAFYSIPRFGLNARQYSARHRVTFYGHAISVVHPELIGLTLFNDETTKIAEVRSTPNGGQLGDGVILLAFVSKYI